MNPTSLQIVAVALFGIALIHTFSTKFFERLAHTSPTHAGLWHLLGEIEVVFGFWAMVLMLVMFAVEGKASATAYIDGRNFTEPMFVFAIMVVAGSKPILETAGQLTRLLARGLPLPDGLSFALVTLSVVPLLGSFITEPAAMTLAALLLHERLFMAPVSARLKYATLGVLFVNVSIGGTLTQFAAPPVLMVAGVWGWDMSFMFHTFGWKAAVAVMVNAIGLVLLFRQELRKVLPASGSTSGPTIPWTVSLIHLVFLTGVVVFAHNPAVFMALFLFFMGFTTAYAQYQNPLILREGLLVAFFLAGLVVLGGQQQWWLEPLLMQMDHTSVFFGATALTAITDNAALTYLGSLVEGLSDEFKVALVAGAVSGGGLTLIANAPNPAGAAILKDGFAEKYIHPGGLLLAALLPTAVAMAAFALL
ncbi:putative Na+/H+ antiporter [Aquabacterium sp.]|uniref:putative Na+/H+ antiporter n=1 Tax=Aquabacterium sp. TaxID=1872578 RepID=UPI001999A764|nr:putative Na+/H+ antiporter [Aquabacterium sp.]MBC7702266.1 putative Na+/H+ antiporter [Aquabacterium sp.]